MMHLFFNAKRVAAMSALNGRAIKRDRRTIKNMIKMWARDGGRQYIDISSADTEWRTRFYWMNYFEDRGFSVEVKNKPSFDCIRISW